MSDAHSPVLLTIKGIPSPYVSSLLERFPA